MGSIIQGHELSLHCKPTFIPRTVSDFLGHVSMIGNVSDRLMKFDEFVKRLEDELRKIEAFKRELPLCMLLINDAIIAVKEELKQCRKSKSEPILEQFIPLKKSCDEEDNNDKKIEIKKEKDIKEKMNWLSSVQLWNNNSSSSNDNRHPSLDLSSMNNNKRSSKPEIEKKIAVEENHVSTGVAPNNPFKSGKNETMGMAFVPFKGQTSFPPPAIRMEEKEELPVLPGLTLQTPGIRQPRDESRGLSSKLCGSRIGTTSASNDQLSVRSGSQLSQQQQQQNARKQRRCWSPELHRRFVDALQQLGGTQVATPKQIRELMQVDGLTNDEVKSHLQKYRLHTRKAPPSSTSNANQTALVLGGLWPSQDQSEESSKRSNSQSGSPQGPIQLCGASRGTSMTGGDSMEDEDDEKSESHSWKNHHLHSSEKIHV